MIKVLFEEIGIMKVVQFDEIDKVLEEKKRGIIINVVYILYEFKNRCYVYIDCLGYIDFIKNMIMGIF